MLYNCNTVRWNRSVAACAALRNTVLVYPVLNLATHTTWRSRRFTPPSNSKLPEPCRDEHKSYLFYPVKRKLSCYLFRIVINCQIYRHLVENLLHCGLADNASEPAREAWSVPASPWAAGAI